ncbi:MAG: sulfate transporter [Sideroxydans sp. RIFOXYB12_FULL_59_6]|nr:MAG: sulfate transporter [Sideroxydans sp. RIFOXYB12_FULL_59_6]
MSTSTKPTPIPIPAGYRADASGRLIPESMIKPVDLKRDEVVCVIAEEAKKMQEALRIFKLNVMHNIKAFVDFSAQEYNVVLGGKKGNLTLYSFDGAYKVQVQIAEHMVFDERLQAAKHLIDECITDWSQGSRDEIKVLVQDAFQTDKEGKINTGRVLGLRRLDIQDEKWQTAMKAIGESLQVVGSKEYVRFYERIEGTDEYRSISLDVAAV